MKKLSPIVKVSLFSFIINIGLSATKLLFGIIGHSDALVADAVHSISDVVTTIIVIIAYYIGKKNADKNHQYGHEKYESLASFCIAIILAYTGIRLGYSSILSIINKEYLYTKAPELVTLIIAATSILLKEFLFQITIRVGKKEHSDSVIADAWHHRSDALSSIGSFIGIICARFFGILIADDVARIVICLFILKVAYDIGSLSVKKLTDTACTIQEENKIRDIINDFSDVDNIDLIKTRLFGDGYFVDVEIQVNGILPLFEAHQVAEDIHQSIKKEIPEVKHCMIHVNPAQEEDSHFEDIFQ